MSSKAFTRDGVPLIKTAFDTATFQPEGWTGGYFINARKEQVFYAKIPGEIAEGGKPHGTIVLNTGYNDSIYYYYDTIHEWQKRGYDIYAMDWAGQGASQRDPNHPDLPSDRPLSEHVRDLDQFVSTIVKPNAQGDLILVGHSMGGNIDSQYLKTHPGIFTKAILAAPMLEFNTSPVGKPIFKGLANLATEIGLKNSSLPNWRDALFRLQTLSAMSTDNAYPEMNASEKFREHFKEALKPYDLKLPTWGWVHSAYNSIDTVTKPGYFKDIKTDILFIAAGKDELVSNDAIRTAAKDAPHAQILNLPTSRHGIWETGPANQAILWNRIDNFTGSRDPHISSHLQMAQKTYTPEPIPFYAQTLVPAA